MSTKSDAERKQFLASLGLNPDAPALATQPLATVEVKPAEPEAPSQTIPLAPDGVDPRKMPVTDIVFDPRLLDGFPDLTGEGMAAASRYVFALYRSQGRNKDRNSLLHSRIGKFIAQVRRERNTGGHVKEEVKATRDERDLAALLAAKGIKASDLAKMLDTLSEEEGE